MNATLVRGGENTQLFHDPKTGAQLMPNAPLVYGEMLLTVAREYSAIPDVRTLTFAEIAFFYNGLRGDLKRATKG